MLLRGFADAIMMRSQQALPLRAKRASCHLTTTIRSSPTRRDHDLLRGDAFRYRSDEPVVPLQIGARDVAFPFLNNLTSGLPLLV